MLTYRAVREESCEVYFNSNYSMIFISEISFENKYFTDCMACVLEQRIQTPKVPLPGPPNSIQGSWPRNSIPIKDDTVAEN